MFRTKLEVDKHVDNCLKKINNETERNLKSFSFAKLYFSVGDYEQARRYVASYLNVKPKSAEGYQLLGKCLEKTNKKDAALEAYKNSLQIDPKQNNVVVKVCELLSSDDVDMDNTGARYFCELAQSFDPNNTAVHRLKEKLITKQSDDPLEVSKLLLKELENRPTDVNLRVRLLKHFLQYNMISEAYKHASAIEEKNLSIFHTNLNWYETFSEVLIRLQRDIAFKSQITWEFWMLYVSVLDRLVTLSLDEHIDSVKTSVEYIAAVFNFDQILTKASQNLNNCPDRQLVAIFLDHYNGQLNFHLATLAKKQAKSDLLPFKEVSNITLPLLLVAYHSSPPDLYSMWFIHTSENNKRLVQHWYKQASYRCSQTGHILLAAAKNRKSLLIEKATHYTTGMWREQFFKKVFVKRDHHLNISTSYFVSNSQLSDLVFKLPDPEEVLKYDEAAQLMFPDSLHHYIWIALNNKLSDMDAKAFEGLQYSVKNFSNCSAESLSMLDIQAFLYCATLCVKSKAEDKKILYFNKEKPKVLPASITDSLGTLNQSNFYKVAYKMYKNEHGSSMNEIRLLLIRGIEVVRCVGNHGLDVELLVKLAEIFEERTKKLTKQSEIEYSTARAELYWKQALPLLEKIKNNQLITYPSNRLFEYKSNEMSLSEAANYIEKGKLFTGVQLMKKKEYEKALHTFEQLKDPYASFYQSQIYKHMADQKTNDDSKENVTSEMRSQHIILLSKARDCLYLTLDRLRDPSVDRSHPLNSQLGSEIEKMERLLSRIDPDCTNRNECDGMSDENPSSENSVGEQYLSTYTHTSFHNGHHFTPKHETHNHSTPLRFSITRQEAKPSPERLDAQIRQMAASRDAGLSNVVEQNKLIVESHRSLLEELRSFKDAINNLTSMVDEFKTIKTGFGQIKQIEKSVEELRNSFDLSNLMDSIQEMRKEINELKKEQSKNNQLSDEDLHFLDPDYAVDYNINANLGYNPSIPNIYTNYQAGRIQNPTPMAYPGIYPGLYPGFYGPLAIPQPAAGSFAADQQNLGASVAAANYAQSTFPHAALPPVLSTTIGVGMLTGQSLSQTSSSARALHNEAISTTPQSTTASATTPLSGFISTSKAPPVNVVITSSDPLPTNVAPSAQPILSVTIPPQHIKGSLTKAQPHSYQIPLPSSNLSQVTTAPSVLSKPPPAIATQSILSNVAPPIFSAIRLTNITKFGDGLNEKSLDQSQISEKNASLNLSNISTTSLEENDPCPDFKPIIPLPDEVPVNTGEEGEVQLFCEHAKLFRHVNTNGTKEWKERGVGMLKILHNPDTGKVRIIMRRDQVHKICANHFITDEMNLTPMIKSDKAYIWVAHDFADEVVVVETFCVRFKTTEQATLFHKAFMNAKTLKTVKNLNDISIQKVSVQKPTETESKNTSTSYGFNESNQKENTAKTTTIQPATLGGFVFSSTPTFKPKETETSAKIPEVEETSKNSPFSNFSFSKINTWPKTSEAPTFSPLVISQSTSTTQNDDETGSHAEEFVPTAEFKPVVALPDLVEVKTGEEDMEVLFENRCKLFRYDGDSKEWKERGVGNIKVLKGEDIRIIMRRDQVHKVCCNHTLLKNMKFSLKDSVGKAVVWTAQDFSEGLLKNETFTARFKSEDQSSQFLQVIQAAQTSLDENNKVVNSKHHKPETRPRTTSFGEKFKPAKGSWECKNCYIINEGKTNFCIACETPRSGNTPKKTEQSGPVFSFGNFTPKSENTASPTGMIFGQKPAVPSWEGAAKVPEKTPDVKFSVSFGQKPVVSSWGNAFKPAEGSWECKTCYIRNSGDKEECVSCSSLKEGNAKDGAAKVPEKISIDRFSVKTAESKTTEAETAPSVGFGDAFKPKAGSWECQVCLIRNKPDAIHCVSCENPRDGSIPKKEPSKGINLETPGLKFNFGMPSTNTPQTTLGSSSFSTTSFGNFSSSIIKNAEPGTGSSQNQVSAGTKFVFGSPQKHEFEFKPKSPRRISSGQGDDESDGNYTDEEEDNIYFKPVVPLPEKVEVITGEEQEEVLYCHRAKLFRFVNSEWKERGLGDVKVLRSKDTGKLRVVMRREQVLKICLNHILTDSIEYIKKDDKSWLFHAADYSEGEIVHEQFCLRFKSPEVAQEFKKAVNDALKDVVKSDQAEKAKSINSSDDDVEIVSETKVTSEEEKEALALGLPPKFFAYRQLPDCTCDQCKKDDLYLKDLLLDSKQSSEKRTSQNTPTATKFVFGGVSSNLKPSSGPFSMTGFNLTPQNQSTETTKATPTSTIDTFSFTPQNQNKSESLKEILMQPSKLSFVNSTEKIPTTTTEQIVKTEAPKPFSFTSAFSQSNIKVSNMFSEPPATNIFSSNTGGLFSNSNTGIFNSPSITSTGGNIFTGGSIFGNTGGADSKSSTKSIFGNISSSPSVISSNSSLFDGSITNLSDSNKSSITPFGGTSIFGGASTQPKNLFGGKLNESSETTTKDTPIFGVKSSETSKANLTFGSVSQNTEPVLPVTTNLKEDDDVILKCNSDISFATLAAQTTPTAKPAFSKTGDSSFSFLGKGAPVFGSASKDSKKKTNVSSKSNNESDDEVVDENPEEEYDPHYEPIVPLPDAIVVSTGEEDEIPLFNERAKLFRYDDESKEWKERGIGQLKILHHPHNQTYRLLLRREQVHKVVLNQLIIPSLQLQPMMTSDKAWMWAGYNYTDDGNELEKLAVRFKNSELAKQFQSAFEDCMNKIVEIQNNRSVPSTVQNYGLEDVSSDEQNTLDDPNNEDYEDEEDEDDRSVMFMKRCTLYDQSPDGSWHNIMEGDLQVYYDPELYSARISANDDDGKVLSNTLIGVNTEMTIDKTECIWRAVEWADGNTRWRCLKAKFSNEEDAEEFHANYLESLNYAHQVGVVDEIPTEADTETEE